MNDLNNDEYSKRILELWKATVKKIITILILAPIVPLVILLIDILFFRK